MSETGNYDPGPFTRRTFADARRDIDEHAGRSYQDAVRQGVRLEDLVPPSISTDSVAPLVVVVDQTGSMGEWPKVIFSKLGYLQHEAKEYLGDDNVISWSAIGDAQSYNPPERYPLQVRPFTSGLALEDELREIKIEGQGGGQGMETYELAALYYARNVSMPNAVRPIIIFIGDEKPYDMIDPDTALRVARVGIERRLSTEDVFEELKSKFETFLIRKPYKPDGDSMSAFDREARRVWSEMLGEDHIYDLPDPKRVVDVIFGLLAKATKRMPYFWDEIRARQQPEQVAVVAEALRDDPIHWAK